MVLISKNKYDRLMEQHSTIANGGKKPPGVPERSSHPQSPNHSDPGKSEDVTHKTTQDQVNTVHKPKTQSEFCVIRKATHREDTREAIRRTPEVNMKSQVKSDDGCQTHRQVNSQVSNQVNSQVNNQVNRKVTRKANRRRRPKRVKKYTWLSF